MTPVILSLDVTDAARAGGHLVGRVAASAAVVAFADHPLDEVRHSALAALVRLALSAPRRPLCEGYELAILRVRRRVFRFVIAEGATSKHHAPALMLLTFTEWALAGGAVSFDVHFESPAAPAEARS